MSGLTTLGSHLEGTHWSRPVDFHIVHVEDDHPTFVHLCQLTQDVPVTDWVTFAIYPVMKGWRRSVTEEWRPGSFGVEWMQRTGIIVTAVPQMQRIRQYLVTHLPMSIEAVAEQWAAEQEQRPQW